MIEKLWQEYRRAVFTCEPDPVAERQLKLTFYAGFKKALDTWDLSKASPTVLERCQEEFADFLSTLGRA